METPVTLDSRHYIILGIIMTEVSPGIFWLKQPILVEDSGADYINVYLISGPNGYLLIDAGWNTDSSFASFHNHLVKHGIGFEDIAQIFITHAHSDHYGMAGRIAKLSGASIMMHRMEQEYIIPRYVQMEELLQKMGDILIQNGVPENQVPKLRDSSVGMENYVVAVHPARILRQGETGTNGDFTFQVIWTPGHSSGHLCLYEPQRKILISGDHILPRITPNVSVHPQSIENPLGRYISALQEMRRLDINLVLPGHNEPFTDAKGRIDSIIKHHESRNAEILSVMNKKPMTGADIAGKITWKKDSRWIDLSDFHRRVALCETIAHLDMMAGEGKVERYPRDGIVYYRQT
jgi:glyoxylase-like metal-dependent hydrolase (beta-lactamase superfamily II)